jgi:GMP synthase (glutamine-hydrolysing)
MMGDTTFATLERLATVIINEEKELNRVLWFVSGGAIQNVKAHKRYLTPERITVLQQADDVVMKFIVEKGLNRAIWQFPTVLLPMSVNSETGESIVLRPVESEEAMTANFYQMDLALVKELSERLMKISGVTAVFYDVTNKPPGTIEWE